MTYALVLAAGLVLAVASSISAVTGSGFLVTSAGAAWPWLWLGFFGAHSLRLRSMPVQLLGGMVATALPLFLETWIDIVLGVGASDTPMTEAIVWLLAGTAVGLVTSFLNILYRSVKSGRVPILILFQGLSIVALMWSIRDRVTAGDGLYADMAWYAVWAILHIAVTATFAYRSR